MNNKLTEPANDLIFEISLNCVASLLETNCEFEPISRDDLLRLHRLTPYQISSIESYAGPDVGRVETMTPSCHLVRVRARRANDAFGSCVPPAARAVG
jgi:hypothetical protein